jgi:hypothetical protein
MGVAESEGGLHGSPLAFRTGCSFALLLDHLPWPVFYAHCGDLRSSSIDRFRSLSFHSSPHIYRLFNDPHRLGSKLCKYSLALDYFRAGVRLYPLAYLDRGTGSSGSFWRAVPQLYAPDEAAFAFYLLSRGLLQRRGRVRRHILARPRRDHRGVDLISDALPFGRLWYCEPNAVSNAIGYASHYSRSHGAVIRVYDEAGNVIETQEHTGDFKEP